MSSRPNPAHLAKYQAELLTELLAARDTARRQRNDHRVKALNRQIQAKMKWTGKAQAAAAPPNDTCGGSQVGAIIAPG